MDQIIQVSYNDLKRALKEIQTESEIEKFNTKPQITLREAYDNYGEVRVKKWIKSGLLKSESHNGHGTKRYFSHLKIIKLSQESRHNLSNIKL